MHRKYRKLVSAGLVLTMAGAMTLQGCGQKEKTGKTEIELVQYKPEAVKTFEKIEEEFNYIATKLGISPEELRQYFTMEKKFYWDYKNNESMFKTGAKVLKALGIEKSIKR